MAIEKQVLKRRFKYGSLTLPDPGNQYSPDQVKEFYSHTYAELMNFVIEGPELKGQFQQYEFVKDVGTKG